MKTKLIILITFFVTITTIAQQGINYKAIVKDNLGNVVANQSVIVQFDINLGLNTIYQENHTVNSDANGLVILNIGTGNVLSGNFSTIDWSSSGTYYLKVQMDTGSGLVNLGATQFRTVPFALYAETSGNVEPTGLEALDEGNGIGWRLIGSDPAKFGDIGQGAVDVSHNLYENSHVGATGSYSFAAGIATTASGSYSTAFGYSAYAPGNYSIALGYVTEAIGDSSIAAGSSTVASGDYSTAFGRVTEATGNYSTAFGNSTEAIGNYSTTMGLSTIANDDYSTVVGKFNDNTTSTTKLFQIGNGINSSSRSNAITVLQNGFTAVGTHTEAPTADFQVNHGTTNINGFKLQNSGSNANWWRFYTVNSTGLLYLYSKAGTDSSPVGSFNDDSGAYSALSDRRVKENFKELHFNWQDFMQLKPLTYYYKTDKNKQLNIGFIAQDVEPIYPELVNYNKEDDLYQLNYSGFGVVAIKAIQELKSEVKSLSEENKKLKSLLANQEQSNSDQAMVLQTLLDRVEAIEKDIINKKVTIVKN